MSSNITIEEALQLKEPTDGFLCDLDANTYGIEFVYFKIRNINAEQGNQTLFEVKKQESEIGKPLTNDSRTVKYHFGPMFFHLKTIGTTLEFKIGDRPVKDFTMIQRHYFKNKLIKSYDFEAPFCIPNTKNSLQAVYNLPEFTQQQIDDMIASPYQTKSDSLYFVQGKLIMHNKAEYSYAPFE